MRAGATSGAPKRIRTSNLQIRSLMLYPVELWALMRLTPATADTIGENPKGNQLVYTEFELS